MQNIGLPGIILIVLLALILFGPKKLPELGRAFGRTLREFKEGTKELLKDGDDSEKGSPAPHASAGETDRIQAADAPPPAKKDDKRLPD